MAKSSGFLFLFLVVVMTSVVSAGFFEDFFGITGKQVSSESGSSEDSCDGFSFLGSCFGGSEDSGALPTSKDMANDLRDDSRNLNVKGCCKKSSDGKFCNVLEAGNCDSGFLSGKSCDKAGFCKRGTCINENIGRCISGVLKAKCEYNGAYWKSGPTENVPLCKKGCCTMGNNVSYSTKVSCNMKSEQRGVDSEFSQGVSPLECYKKSSAQGRFDYTIDYNGSSIEISILDSGVDFSSGSKPEEFVKGSLEAFDNIEAVEVNSGDEEPVYSVSGISE